VSRDTDINLEQFNTRIADIAEALEVVLRDFLLILNKRHNLPSSNPAIEVLLKRTSLAVIAMSYVPEKNLDKTLKLNLHLPTLPPDGIDELIETTSEIRDFYSYVMDGTTATTHTEIISGRLTHTFVRPEFPIILDAEN